MQVCGVSTSFYLQLSISSGGSIVDYAHESTGFPTWHRLFLLWLEREIQVAIDNTTFRIPYWDWSQPSQREILFKSDRLGENRDGTVVGDLFTDWETYCWQDMSDLSYPVPICDPSTPSGQILRRCPNAKLCNSDNPNWPTSSDVNEALSIEDYDDDPFDRFVTNTASRSFRNYLEGFLDKPDGCADDRLCTPAQPSKNRTAITRKLHNTVSICN